MERCKRRYNTTNLSFYGASMVSVRGDAGTRAGKFDEVHRIQCLVIPPGGRGREAKMGFWMGAEPE
jgi:hypothetical protein